MSHTNIANEVNQLEQANSAINKNLSSKLAKLKNKKNLGTSQEKK